MTGNTPTAAEQLTRNKWRTILIVFVALAALAAAGNYLLSINPLPKDEEMIAHFQAHRAEIEELIRRYRAFTPPPNKDHFLWMDEPGTRALFQKAGVKYVDYIGVPWLPNPYSVETAKKLEASWGNYEKYWRHGGMRVRLIDQRYFTVALRYNNYVWKDLYFIPELPRVERGWLWGPVDIHGKSRPLFRVLPSLNDYPPHWQPIECVLRQIEPQWFIEMCRS